MTEVLADTIPISSPRELSEPVTQGPAKHHKGQLMEWVRAPITGKLSEIPGVGPAAITHLSTVTEETKGRGGEEIIDSTHQLLGKYLLFKGLTVSNVENAQMFYTWLKTKGVNSHLDCIVESVAEKVNVMIPGCYAAEEFVKK